MLVLFKEEPLPLKFKCFTYSAQTTDCCWVMFEVLLVTFFQEPFDIIVMDARFSFLIKYYQVTSRGNREYQGQKRYLLICIGRFLLSLDRSNTENIPLSWPLHGER